MTNHEGMPKPEGVTRRSFLVMIGGAILGSHFLPLPVGKLLAPDANTGESIRDLLGLPIKTEDSNGSFSLIWGEKTATGPEFMIWRPETDEERAQAQRFYEDAHGLKPGSSLTHDPEPYHPHLLSGMERILIDRILDNPDDDAPRLAYAIWLEKRGNLQGEFVRLRCTLAKMDTSDPQVKPLIERIRYLRETESRNWLEPLLAMKMRAETEPAKWLQAQHEFWLAPRGLVEEVHIYREGILPERAAELFAAAPVLHKIQQYAPVDFPALAACPQMKQVTSLALPSRLFMLTVPAVQALAASPNLLRLSELNLRNESGIDRLDPEAALALVSSPLLAHLRTLNLHGCRIGDDAVAVLTSNPDAMQLSYLNLEKNSLTSESARHLAGSPHLKSLKVLRLAGNGLTSEDVQVLQESLGSNARITT